MFGQRLASARKTWDTEQQAALQQAAADAKQQALVEAGDWKGLFEGLKGDLEKERTERQQERTERLKAELDAAKARIASKHFGNRGLEAEEIADLTDRLRGKSEAELDADAARLVKLVGTRRAPETPGRATGQRCRQDRPGTELHPENLCGVTDPKRIMTYG